MKKKDVITINQILDQINLSAMSADARKELLHLSLELSPVVCTFNEQKQIIQEKLFKELQLDKYLNDKENPEYAQEKLTEEEFSSIVSEILEEEITINYHISEDTISQIPDALPRCNLPLLHYLMQFK